MEYNNDMFIIILYFIIVLLYNILVLYYYYKKGFDMFYFYVFVEGVVSEVGLFVIFDK